jgi:hypothetical protein
MKAIQHASPWRKFSLRLIALIIVSVAGGWALSSVFASKPATVGAAAPVAAAAAISPLELMATHGRQLPVTEYAEPF